MMSGVWNLDRLSAERRLRHRDAARDRRRLPDPSLAPGTDRVPEVRHIVLLMMENHSFDNYLGALGRGDGLPDPPPVNHRNDGEEVRARPMATTGQLERAPSQSWYESHQQHASGRNDGFVRSVERVRPDCDPAVAMGYWTSAALPFYASLASTFPIADRWFSSCLGPTFPNRRFLVAATANGLVDDVAASVIDYPRTGTIFDLLNRCGISWANYHHVPPHHLLARRIGGAATRRSYRAGRLAAANFGIGGLVRGRIECTANLYPLSILRTLHHLRHISRFFRDAAAGELPAVSLVDPDFEGCSEENPQNVQLGEGFAAAVINAVMDSPAWRQTVLIWFYDEHGGYYDHVAPPAAPEPDGVRPHSLLDTHGPIRWALRHTSTWRRLRHDDAGASGERYDRYGFRVPAVIVAAHARPHHVSSTVFDHTSALKLIEEKWNLPPLTERDAQANAPWEMLDLGSTPAFDPPPRLAAPAQPWSWTGR
jgi:phospholipase C